MLAEDDLYLELLPGFMVFHLGGPGTRAIMYGGRNFSYGGPPPGYIPGVANHTLHCNNWETEHHKSNGPFREIWFWSSFLK